MDLKTPSQILSNICYACQEFKPENIDLDDMENWRELVREVHYLTTKNGEEYQFMKTIIDSFKQFMECIPVIEGGNTYEDLEKVGKLNFLNFIESNYETMKGRLQQLRFNLSFYEQFGYFNNNVVAVGANGSGKTSLADNLRSSLNNNGLVISAQRVLFIPDMDNIPNPLISENRWVNMNKRSRTFKDTDDFDEIKEEFGYVLANLVSKHCNYAIEMLDKVKSDRKPSELEITFNIWNDIFEHRVLKLVHGIKLKVFVGEHSYDPIKLSEGEKSALYLISQVIQAPEGGFIIIDEPEMYLHKTIISKIWDALELQRQDCKFIYLTHDLDFAVSRNSAAKIWLRSFEYPNIWNIQKIPENLIPEKLMLELLGSRKNILFCEGAKGSIDQTIYQTLLPNFTIMPVQGCLNVINFTKAYNKIPNLNTKAYGIIDADHHTNDRLSKLRDHQIYSLKLAEVENLFLEEKLLEIFAAAFFKETRLKNIKEEVLKELDKEKELQASRYVSNKINNIFNDSHVEKANSVEKIISNFVEFNAKIEIEKWYQERLSYIKQIILDKNYKEAISIFNNKGLKVIIERNLGKGEYTDYVLKYLHTDKCALSIVRNLLPTQLITLSKGLV